MTLKNRNGTIISEGKLRQIDNEIEKIVFVEPSRRYSLGRKSENWL